MSVYRADQSNVGDHWSPPFRYFPFSSKVAIDLVDIPSRSESRIVIVGGGGLGRDGFQQYLDVLNGWREKGSVLVGWGVGSDVASGRNFQSSLEGDLCGEFFDNFDEVGARLNLSKHRWVPCASCMHEAFYSLRITRPTARIGVYSHKRQPLVVKPLFIGSNEVLLSLEDGLVVSGFENNKGNNIVEKLRFMAKFEYIITNSYHGVYWATLLGRKVICVPQKSGLFTFRHPPVHANAKISESTLLKAIAYESALEDCRAANIEFYQYLYDKYGDL